MYYLLFAVSACVSDKTQHVMLPMPKPPFKIDRRLLSHHRPARAYGKPYQGPIIDVHVHLQRGQAGLLAIFSRLTRRGQRKSNRT